MNILESIRKSINTLCVKYINNEGEIFEDNPIFYIAGSQTLPPPLTPDEEENILRSIGKRG